MQELEVLEEYYQHKKKKSSAENQERVSFVNQTDHNRLIESYSERRYERAGPGTANDPVLSPEGSSIRSVPR
jgi:hypothetical protein